MKMKFLVAALAALFVGAAQADFTVVGSAAVSGGVAGEATNISGWGGTAGQMGGAASGAAVASTASAWSRGPATGGFTASGAQSRQSTYGGSYLTGVGNPTYNGAGSYGVQQSSASGGTISVAR